MTDQMQNVLAGLIEQAVASVDAAVEFSKAEIPQVIEQLLIWKFAQSSVYTLLALAIFVAIYFGWKRVIAAVKAEIEKHPSSYNRSEAVMFALPVGAGLATFLSGALAVAWFNLTWLQILVAPKLYLLEYGARLLK